MSVIMMTVVRKKIQVQTVLFTVRHPPHTPKICHREVSALNGGDSNLITNELSYFLFNSGELQKLFNRVQSWIRFVPAFGEKWNPKV